MDLLLNGKQDGGLKPVVFDRVHGAGRSGTVLVGGAGVVHMAAAHAPGQSLSAIRAAEEAAEYMYLPSLGGGAGVPLHQALHLFKGRPVNNGLVGVRNPYPILLRHRLDLVDLVALDTVAALYQIASINLIGEDFMDHAGAPHGIVIYSRGNRQSLYVPVGRGAGDAVLVQVH